MDTRNRYQRMYDANYEGKPTPIPRERLSETEVDKFNRLSDMYGHTLRHPRTRDIIRMRTADIIPPRTMPRTKRGVAPKIQIIKATRTKEGIEAEIITGKNKRKSWKSVWYSGHNRKK